MKKTLLSRIWLLLAFAAIYFVWGTTYLANLYALKAIPPFIISALRYVIAGLVLAAVAYMKKLPVPDKNVIKHLGISGVIMLVGGSGLVVVAEQYISSGSAAVIVATEPLWFVLLDKRRWKMYFASKIIIAGLLTGFAGIALFAHFAPVPAGAGTSDQHRVLGVVLVLSSCILWVIGTLYSVRKIKQGSYNLWHTCIQLLAAGVFSCVIALLNGEWLGFAIESVPLPAWGGLAFLTVFGSLVAYLAFSWLVTVQPPAVVSTHTYINPVMAVFIGWLIASEKVAGMQVVGLAVALAGVVLTQVYKQRESTT